MVPWKASSRKNRPSGPNPSAAPTTQTSTVVNVKVMRETPNKTQCAWLRHICGSTANIARW
jgi:hypothetical protein